MKLKCPHCGNKNLEDMYCGEWVPSQRRISGMRGKVLFIGAESNEIMEAAKDPHIFCEQCWETFEIPKGVELEVGDLEEAG